MASSRILCPMRSNSEAISVAHGWTGTWKLPAWVRASAAVEPSARPTARTQMLACNRIVMAVLIPDKVWACRGLVIGTWTVRDLSGCTEHNGHS
jgi:hypothetical protein